MTQTAIPFLFLRGGTSRGPYFRKEDLPADRDTLTEVLLSVIGGGNPHSIDGMGGSVAVTTKVAILSPSLDPDIDVDFFFAQIAAEERLVDYGPTCGNILIGVGPAAIEMGIVPPTGDVTRVRIKAVNTGAPIEALVQTPGGRVLYDGEAAIDGVPGTAAPIVLSFLDAVGSQCGVMLPTGQMREVIDGIEVTCIDVAMPMMIARAADFGLTGYETPAELDANREFFARAEQMRLEAGRRMGLGDVTKSVTPKIGILSPPRHGGVISARYFMPWKCHPTLAVTGSQCIAACALTPGTVADGLGAIPSDIPALMRIEHPVGEIEVTIDYSRDAGGFALRSAGLVRTARLIARGEVMVPSRIWTGF